MADAIPRFLIQIIKLFGCLAFSITALSCRQVATADIVIIITNIPDVQNGQIFAGRDVLIEGNRITDITLHGQSHIQSAQLINGANQYLISGLWEMHEHMMREQWLFRKCRF